MNAPPLWLTAMEARAAAEYASWNLSRRALSTLRRGDGHPVLVLPGFTAADRSTIRLRELLRELGYRTYGWKLGANLGPTPHIRDGLRARLDGILEREQQKVSIVGWSLGGIYGRQMARRTPESIRQVITLGSPFRLTPADRSAASGLWDSLSPMYDPEVIEQMSVRDLGPLPVPTTSVYTRGDGIVRWRACLETKGPFSENVEVFGSHSGLGFNPSVAVVVANRLAQPEDSWRRFRPPLWLRGLYPPPAHWKPITAPAPAA